jgi:hypothetical protein
MAVYPGVRAQAFPAGRETHVPTITDHSFTGSSSGFLRRWEVATRDREKRQGRRRSLHCPVLLTGDEDGRKEKQIQAQCINIGDSGLFAVVPASANVAIGQRYTFRLDIGERGPEPGCHQSVAQQGEIIRLELLLGEDGYADRIGVAVRLCGPRCGIVPMPAMR